MEELTAGLLGTGMVMVGGGTGGMVVGVGGSGANQQDVEFPVYSPSYSSSSSSSGSSPTYYNSTQPLLPSELFTEFDQFSAFELSTGNPAEDPTFLNQGSSDEERTYMEELISSDLSSDEDKFLETIRYGGGGVVHFSNDLLSEEELVKTINGYGDVKVVQIDSGEVEAAGVEQDARVFEVVEEENKLGEKKSGGGGGGKKRKGSVGGSGGSNGKAVKRAVLLQTQPSPPKKSHKQSPQPRTFSSDDDEIIIETNGEVITADVLGSPSPGSPQQQQQDSNGTFQELKLSEEEKRLLMKEGISLPTHYPLTKLEERELKRIRRKIRNKISAQDSRKRKKEFLDRLQMKLQEVEDEKSTLQKRVRSLESINNKLNTQVKRLQQALASATSSVQNTINQNQQKQTVVPAATTLLVLILSLALVVLPTSMDQRTPNSAENANEIISLLNRSNEMARENGRVLGNPDNKKLSVPKSRTMVSGDDDDDEQDIMDVKELIGQMRQMLRKRKQRGGEVGGFKRGRFDTSGLSGLLGMKGLGADKDDQWWQSEEDDEDQDVGVIANRIVGKKRVFGGGNSGVGGGGGRKHAFQIVDDVEVD